MGSLKLDWPQFYATLSNLATNLSLVLAGVVLYLLVVEKRPLPKLGRQLSLGVGLGLLASFSILLPVEIKPGIQIDSKYALVLIASMYGGGPVGLLTMALASLTRLYLGGIGIYAALPTMALCWGFGTSLYRYRQSHRNFQPGFWFFLLLGLLLFVIHVSGGLVYFMLLPQEHLGALLWHRALPAFLIYPILSLVLGLLLEFIYSRRELGERHSQLLLDLAQRNNELQNLYYSLLHDLRTPVVSIQGFLSEALAKLPADAPANEDLNEVQKASRQLYRMLQGLSEYGRLAQTTGDVPACCFPEAVLRQLSQEMEQTLRAAKAQIRIEAGAWPRIGMDPRDFNQLSRLLLDNALQFSKPGSPPLLTIASQPSQHTLLITYTDNGIGLAPPLQRKVFNLFEKVSPKHPGMGLGLPLARRLAEKYHGELWLESPGEGLGLTLFLRLPLYDNHTTQAK